MQPCSQPRYVFTARSKPISGELFQLITDFVASRVSVVASGGSSATSPPSVSQPSSNGLAVCESKRTPGLVVAPRPRRASEGMAAWGGGSGVPAISIAATAARSLPVSRYSRMVGSLSVPRQPDRAGMARQEQNTNVLAISVVIPALNAAATLPGTLRSLRPAEEVIVADAGSADGTQDIAQALGCRIVQAPRGRGCQLAAGVAAASQAWLLLLHADTRLQPGWAEHAIR